MWPLSVSAWSACGHRHKRVPRGSLAYQLLSTRRCSWYYSPPWATWISIESSSCLPPYPASLALCLVEALSCGTFPSWLIYGPWPQKSSPAVQRPLDKNKLENLIVNHLYVSFTIIWCLKWFKMCRNTESFLICFKSQTVISCHWISQIERISEL